MNETITTLELRLTLTSDATFGRGDGVAGLVDAEIEHDPDTGLPYLRGRTLKGLLVEECANILYALGEQSNQFMVAAHWLFGLPGSGLVQEAKMHVGTASFPAGLQQAIRADIQGKRLVPAQVLESLSGIRRQTAVDEGTGAPQEGSLRAMRVLLRGTELAATLDFDEPPPPAALTLLAACVLALRRAGLGRNRGSGRLTAALWHNEQDVTAEYFEHFKSLVNGGAI
ncbi:MAG: hypothetical protein KDE59_25925 [Anaerolineales bacterium]|nr:hypothetical protein [Anaerolineales bacterium]